MQLPRLDALSSEHPAGFLPLELGIVMLRRWAKILVCAVLLWTAMPLPAQWRPVGPFGGNARALAYDPLNPDHILLGSGAGSLFESKDGGRHWAYFAHLGPGEEIMLENIAFDPSRPATIYVAGWSVTGSGGGFFLTRDGGRTWTEPEALRGKSVQALAQADPVPGVLIAGTLDGLYRSSDWGENWVRISPEGHPDLKNFESVAVDPRDPRIIYAGTWHLPWKTTDGGAHWSVIKRGVIDDSDVFSIILDRANPEIVFASACSGIYKSENGGELFRKVQGIPGTARRTRVLQQDPANTDTVYAGTTEGLWKTVDGGRSFKLISPPNYILNDVLVDPRNSRRVLMATDRGGVFASDDGGVTFYASNDGFSQRQISTLAAEPQGNSDLYAGVLNDKEFGGVFRAHDGTWVQMSEGLGGLDVFDLGQSPKGQLVAATNRGLFLFEAQSQRWMPSREVVSRKTGPRRSAVRGSKGKKTAAKPRAPITVRSRFLGRAVSLSVSRRWYAATDSGVLVSWNEGKSWKGAALDGQKEFIAVASLGRTVAAASLRGLWYSSDEGDHWMRQPLPAWITRIYSVTIADDQAVWIGTREGAWRWAGEGSAWEHVLNGLAAREVTSVRAEGGLLLAAAATLNSVFVSRDLGQSWKAEPATGFEVTGAAVHDGTLYVTTRHHGVLAREPNPPMSLLRNPADIVRDGR
jgi:photosystem II stability/assembly factor-like uncharacterized protein